MKQKVAPRVGAWIETKFKDLEKQINKSHPVWVRGLKLHLLICLHPTYIVAPRVGAWIETLMLPLVASACKCRTPCGCVD